ncbi:MAG TPA: sialate O-acetylesterase [Puia sp.]|nr:sialate O-acetylesterase [Puia sp.]
MGADSTWGLYFPAQQTGSVGRELRVVSGGDSVYVRNILFGDVWVCIGQSNMEFPMSGERHFAEEKTDAAQPSIRLYNPSYIGKNVYGKSFTDSMLQRLTTTDFYRGAWTVCDSVTVRTMSAVGYYFGKTIAGREHVPIGLIHLAIGGCPIETFMSMDALKEFPGKLDSPWLENNALPVWVRQRGKQNVGERGDAHGYKPGFAFAAGIAPILPMPIEGIIWYQGESNSQEPDRVEEYPRLQKAMVEDYRKKWKQPHLPFYWVQLSSIDTVQYKSRYWPEFRDGQRRMLTTISDGGMAVCSDIGARDNVHPTDKRTVGQRLARWALQDVYGEKGLVVSGPLPVRVSYTRDTVVIYFQYGRGLRTADGGPLRGFSIDGAVVDAVVDHLEIQVRIDQQFCQHVLDKLVFKVHRYPDLVLKEVIIKKESVLRLLLYLEKYIA